ncbi:hypothetical protein FGW37_05490 [Streptomyces rectiverticillatus]|uniref:hypothetical protein n=1 Tax=Streptomyces rectiverticillatus TaxID=173860 RepID=UPI0015C314D1|nr:hypothetical protein [Streptomyces rectiverticillatus]QLE71129.1 hypothetical protein FGW37_05490 [Streptomyces rectiverticillatus]
MDLRFSLYASEEGAVYRIYPGGAGTRPELVEYTAEERKTHRATRDALLDEWKKVDPEGYELWSVATASMEAGDDTELLAGWSAKLLTDDGVAVVDPCRYCRECRVRR